MLIQKIEIKEGEYWYGGAVNDGYLFPLTQNSSYAIDLRKNNTYNQINPLFVSSFGRYIWLEKAGKISFEKGVIEIEAEEIELDESSATLKEAQQKATRKHFLPNGKIPAKIAFESPQICSWIALDYGQNQTGVLEYAQSYIKAGYKPGILIIDDTWQKDYGVWDFDRNVFFDPKGLIDVLHSLGFKVVLWMAPYVSPDSVTYRYLKDKDVFIRRENGELMLAEWWNGHSFVLDFTKKDTIFWFQEQTEYLRTKYGVDGFKLDGGDAQFLDDNYTQANEQNTLWATILKSDEESCITELRACYKAAGQDLIQRLADKAHAWGVEFVESAELPDGGFLKYGMSTLIPNVLTQGLIGYAYGCPDMVGGGLWSDFNGKKLDKELLIRSCQCSALMPMIQFSHPLWEEEETVREAMHQCICIRERYVERIVELARRASVTGEPIVRYMEYEYPHEGLAGVVSQFLLGDSVLVAPVLEKGVKQKKVYFPKNTKWRALSDGAVYGEGSYTFDVDIQTFLVFEKI